MKPIKKIKPQASQKTSKVKRQLAIHIEKDVPLNEYEFARCLPLSSHHLLQLPQGTISVVVDIDSRPESWPRPLDLRQYLDRGNQLWGVGGRGALMSIDFADEGTLGYGITFEHFKKLTISKEEDLIPSNSASPFTLFHAQRVLSAALQYKKISKQSAEKILATYQKVHYTKRHQNKLFSLLSQSLLSFFNEHAKSLDPRYIDTMNLLQTLSQRFSLTKVRR